MVKYYCQNCKTIVETSKCPLCGNRTTSMTKVYWNKELNIPVILDDLKSDDNKFKLISSDIRPVFPE